MWQQPQAGYQYECWKSDTIEYAKNNDEGENCAGKK
jgi:hypothetical protein